VGPQVKLSDLDPHWWTVPDREGPMGLTFLCPHCQKVRLGIAFLNPLDGGPPVDMQGKKLWWPSLGRKPEGPEVVPPGFLWNRTGRDFETLTLMPSVDASPSSHWHGFVTNGRAT
jgi:Family of unknown function (DUF6527)